VSTITEKEKSALKGHYIALFVWDKKPTTAGL